MTGSICRGDPSRSARTAENGPTSAPRLIGRSHQTKFPQSASTAHGPGNAAVTTPSSPLVRIPGVGPLEGLCLALHYPHCLVETHSFLKETLGSAPGVSLCAETPTPPIGTDIDMTPLVWDRAARLDCLCCLRGPGE